MNNLSAAALTSISILLLTACQTKSSQVRTVAVVTLMSHPALDELAQAAKRQILSDAKNGAYSVQFIEQNANQQMNLVPVLVAETLQRNPDVVIAITTPVAQAFKSKMKSKLVFAAVTDPVGAGLVTDLEDPGENITGTSDAWPYRDQLLLIKEIIPGVQTLAVLYNPGEAASQFGIKQIRRYASDMNLKLEEVAVNSVAEVGAAARIAASKADALFLSSDNTVIGGAPAAISVAIMTHKPLFVGDSGTVRKGGLATVSVGYEQLGRETGLLVTRFLSGHNHLPVVVGHGDAVYLNVRAAQRMNVQIPKAVRDRATQIFTDFEK